MSWAKLDDRYDDGAKVRRAWHAHPRAVGLHAMAITYCARNETNGRVDDLWLVEKLPVKREREQVLRALVEAGLFDRTDGGYFVHDYLDYNDSSEVLAERRRKDAERKGRHPPRGKRSDATPESERKPDGIQPESGGTPDASRTGGSAPAGPRPDPTRPDRESSRCSDDGRASGKAVTYQRRKVPDDVVALAGDLLAEFDRQASTTTRLYDGLGEPTEGLRLVIGALLRHGEHLTVDSGPRLIRSVLADPWWNGSASPGVVFGPKVIDRNLQRLASPTPLRSVTGGRAEPGAAWLARAEQWAAEDEGGAA